MDMMKEYSISPEAREYLEEVACARECSIDELIFGLDAGIYNWSNI